MVLSLDGQSVTPEPSPGMIWNTTYSPMFGSPSVLTPDTKLTSARYAVAPDGAVNVDAALSAFP